MSGKVHRLEGSQRDAVDPRECVWLSASAGTGKTQVLSARVLRLLLQPGTDPSQILCLTFTKAGAAEMATRVNEVLARWVRLDEPRLAGELGDLGAPIDPATLARARTLFASVLDCPGGGLRIDTIHAFAQWLLANFPGEAGLIPGTRPMEDRERDLLSRDVLAAMLVEGERAGDSAMLDAIADFSRRKDPDALRAWLMRCAGMRDLWFGPGAWQPPMVERARRLLGLPADADQAWVEDGCSAAQFPDRALRDCLPLLRDWKAATGQQSAEFIAAWLEADTAARFAMLGGFFDTLLKKDGTPRSMATPQKHNPAFADWQLEIADAVAGIGERAVLLEVSSFLASSLELGRRFALDWQAAKEREGLIDFDDLIERAAQLLTRSDMAAWIRYKLDRRFDHVLVDEAQDTNAAQWTIIDALIDDYFSGEGASDGSLRTIFTVGDYKQAIFRFQGTSPENFARAKERVRRAMQAASENALAARRGNGARVLQDPSLDRSFRSAAGILQFVDLAIEQLGWQALGLKEPPGAHIGLDRPGQVTLWHPVRGSPQGAESERENEDGNDWLGRHDRQLADRIAEQVSVWMRDGYPLVKDKAAPRNATPGDVMVLVRKRKELAALIVARLHAKGVPVAGVDRLRLGAPLAVKDLMAALRFAAQPLDDLNLASLLVSPLIGWSQESLLAHAYRGPKVRLWDHLRSASEEEPARAVAKLRGLLALADFEPPQAMLHWMLVGPWQGRRRLVERLGFEANDPIDELLNAAIAYESAHTASLAGFIRWFDAGEGELKRDAGERADLVRVMTVHGSKGLQAPLVILADATGRPGQVRELELAERLPGDAEEEARTVPLPPLSKDQRVGPLAAAHDAIAAEEMEEHWRLLYVAMTRAEEGLFVTGSLGPRDKDGPPADSWYARLAPLFEGDALEDPIWGARQEFGERPAPVARKDPGPSEPAPPLPEWVLRPIGPEPRPPRPLAPSAAGDDPTGNPPMPAQQAQEAARRGVLIHRLLERLPDVAPAAREDSARRWLARQGGNLPAELREEMARTALDLVSDPRFADVFGPDALAEVPLMAVVGENVIAGTADRLLVTHEAVTVVDFKTARRPPASLEAIPQGTLRQLAAYVAALERIYPGRTVSGAVLYTHTPQIFELPDAVLAPFKAQFLAGKESLADSRIV